MERDPELLLVFLDNPGRRDVGKPAEQSPGRQAAQLAVTVHADVAVFARDLDAPVFGFLDASTRADSS